MEEILRCCFCDGISVLEKNDIKVKNGLKQVKAKSIIYRCTKCGRTYEDKRDRLSTSSELNSNKSKANTENRIHRVKTKNADKIPPDTSGERIFKR